MDILVHGDPDAYAKALDALKAETRGWWQDALSGDWQDSYQDEAEDPYGAHAQGLGRFLEAKALPWYEAQIAAIQTRSMIAAQAYGEAADPERLTMLARYETHLDRKLERCLELLARERETRAP